MPTITFDIEVAGFPWEEVDEITRGYLLARAKSAEAREAVSERTALTLGLGKVIAIGMWLVEEDRGMLLLEGRSQEKRDWEKVPKSQILRGGEAELLEGFWDVVRKNRGRLVSYNGRAYDGPVLMVRSAQLGIRPTLNLSGYRYDIAAHTDLMDVFSFLGTTRESYSLDYWCRRFDIESPKGSIDGSQVARAYREGKIEDIGEYCLRDVRATAALYRKVEHTLLPLFKGGG